jgi:hypothetical protein
VSDPARDRNSPAASSGTGAGNNPNNIENSNPPILMRRRTPSESAYRFVYDRHSHSARPCALWERPRTVQHVDSPQWPLDTTNPRAAVSELLVNIKHHAVELEDLLRVCNGPTGVDLLYRFWHHSFKVYFLQDLTLAIRDALVSLAPDGVELDPWFTQIITEGTGHQFELAHNKDWLAHTRPIVEAFFHARFILEHVVQAGTELDDAPWMLPSGWAAVLEIFQLR